MARFTTSYVCQQCGYVSPSYLGRCPNCDNWNTFVEQVEEYQRSKIKKIRPSFGGQKSKIKAEIIELSKLQKVHYRRIDTGFEEFNRVLGGGIVAGSVVLIAGDPGIGKSTLLTQLALNINNLRLDAGNFKLDKEARSSKIENTPFPASNVLYMAGEESAQQIKLRVDRIRQNSNLAVLNEVDVDVIVDAIEQHRPSLVIIDSVQTLETTDLESVAGSVGQVRECAHRLQRIAKNLHIPIFLVGHVTKEGTVAGPKTLEHLVDAVLSLEGEPSSQFRILRSSKNRFGPTDEVGIFELTDIGMAQVKNPSKLFLEQKVDGPGSAVVAEMTGLRPILVEIQALVTKTSLPIPRRTSSGIDNNRLQLLAAVLQKRMGLALYDQDIFVLVTGGLRLTEPAADLGICMAIISSFKDKPITPKTVFIGEVGLLGELRTVRNLDKRIGEARKLGFTNPISPTNARSLASACKISFDS